MLCLGAEKAAWGFEADQIKILVDGNQDILIDIYYGEIVLSTKTPSF